MEHNLSLQKCWSCGRKLWVNSEDGSASGACPFCGNDLSEAPAPSASPSVVDGTPPGQDAPSAPVGQRPDVVPSAVATAYPVHDSRSEGPARGTHVGMILPLALGLAATLVFYGILWVMPDTQFGALFMDRGYVPYVIAFMASLSASFLVVKWLRFRRQKRGRELDVLPAAEAPEIRPDNIPEVRHSLDRIPATAQDSFVVRRVRRALDEFGARGRVQDVVQALNSQADTDADSVASSYSMVKVLIWAMPILGFIGTVMGIGAAVSGFSGSMAESAQFETIRNSLGSVTGGLAMAFDTTLIALVASLLVMFPARWLQKAEEDHLTEVDQYAMERVVPRMKEPGGAPSVSSSGTGRLSESEARQIATLPQRIEALGDKLAERMVASWRQMQSEAHAREKEQLQHVAKALGTASEAQAATLEEFKGLRSNTEDAFHRMSDEFAKAMTAVRKRADETQNGIAENLNKATAELNARLAEQSAELAKRLEEQSAMLGRATETVEDTAGRMVGDVAKVRTQYVRGVAQAADAFSMTMRDIVSGFTDELGAYAGREGERHAARPVPAAEDDEDGNGDGQVPSQA